MLLTDRQLREHRMAEVDMGNAFTVIMLAPQNTPALSKNQYRALGNYIFITCLYGTV